MARRDSCAEKHYFVNIREKISWLEDAGFHNVHTVWQYLFGYVVVGEKKSVASHND